MTSSGPAAFPVGRHFAPSQKSVRMKIPFSFTVPNGGEWLSFHGVPVELILNLAGFGLSRGLIAPGEGASPHRHTFGEGFYLLRGSLAVTVEDEVCHLQPGDFVHLPPNVTHYIKNTGSQGAEVLVFSVPGQFNDFQREVGIAASGPDGPFAPAPRTSATDCNNLARSMASSLLRSLSLNSRSSPRANGFISAALERRNRWQPSEIFTVSCAPPMRRVALTRFGTPKFNRGPGRLLIATVEKKRCFTCCLAR